MSNENTSGLVPLGRAVLVKPYRPEVKKGLIELPDSVELTQMVIEQRAIVIEVGPSCWEGESQPRAKAGDKVLISGFAGFMAKGTANAAERDTQYRFINDKDIFARIEVESND